MTYALIGYIAAGFGMALGAQIESMTRDGTGRLFDSWRDFGLALIGALIWLPLAIATIIMEYRSARKAA